MKLSVYLSKKALQQPQGTEQEVSDSILNCDRDQTFDLMM
ncbi:MAG: hypothetical protein ACJASB_001655 [Shewanella psychromarinicola]|jgi:hypothetical protein